jgi:hypothetical protein
MRVHRFSVGAGSAREQAPVALLYPVGAVSGREQGATDCLMHRSVRFAADDRSYRRSQAQVLTFNPTSPRMIRPTLIIRISAIDSPKSTIPAITVPTAPTPVQMA